MNNSNQNMHFRHIYYIYYIFNLNAQMNSIRKLFIGLMCDMTLENRDYVVATIQSVM